eukprot:CAMPEP_0177632310 /NCGR_PEP_ID=MMETSP0447-20121125/2220_1 /TAXON_ID=0 /ORGANISM="Stygamoeba regulata, Strain BSH-02190019" /LENGTH=192 /DNA_ID=CAMNT_0019133863 /DNA_START=95 /DNA_END=673 /DNA_ORIENTATION=-
MGNTAGSHLKKEELDALAQKTHFNPKELKQIYKQFRKEAPAGSVAKAELTDVMKNIGVTDPFLIEIVYSAFLRSEPRDTPAISFPQFIQTLSVMARGSADEKLKFAFQMFDLDGDGRLTREELVSTLESFIHLVGPLVTFGGKRYETSDALVEDLFEKIDSTNKGFITFEDYREYARHSPDIVQGLSLDVPR